MSSLDKLAIRGIRSFDHENLSVMQFFTPLTIIVGQNGSGKTTIIECLKYATTGDLPPNTKGGAFVHDPSIAGTSEVKAQVKLRFFNTEGQKMLVERRLQVTKKKGTGSGLTMKTLEGVISYANEDRDDRKRNSLSTKCSSLDEEVPLKLGVSKAILENVIFCHQEESNWPLSEPAALKKKFDDIFEATKYTKALDQIKLLRKEQAVEIKIDKEKLAALKTDRDRAIKLRAAIVKLESTLDAKTAEKAKLEEDIAQMTSHNKNFYEQATKYKEIINKIDTLRRQRAMIEENWSEIRATVKELTDTDQELDFKIKNHNQTLQEARNEKERRKNELSDETQKLRHYEEKRSVIQTSHGRLQAEKQRHETAKARRHELVQALSVKHQIPGYSGDLTHEEMKQFESALDDAIRNQQRKLQETKELARDREQKKLDELQKLKSEQSGHTQAKTRLQSQIRSTTNRINEITRKLEENLANVEDIQYKEQTIADQMQRKKDAEEKFKNAAHGQQMQVKTRELKELEERREQLHLELTSLNAQADVRAKLQIKRTEVKRKDEMIDRLLIAATASYKKFTKQEPARETVDPEVTALIRSHEQDLAQAETSSSQAARELQAAESKVSNAQARLKEHEHSAAALKNNILHGLRALDTTTLSNVDEAITEAEAELAGYRSDLLLEKGAADFFGVLLKKAKDSHVCYGCNRGFSAEEMQTLDRYCKSQQAKAPSSVRQVEDSIQEWEVQLVTLRRLQPLQTNLNKLATDDIPAASSLLKEASARIPDAQAKAAETLSRTTELKESLQALRALKKTSTDIVRLVRECDDLKKECTQLESELSASGTTATSDDIQGELAGLGEKIRTVKMAIETSRKDAHNQEKAIQVLSDAIHDAQMDLAKKQQQLKDKQHLEQQRDGLKNEIVADETDLKTLDEQIRSSALPIRKLDDELSALRQEAIQAEADENRKLSALVKSAEQLEANLKEVKSYTTRGIPAELAKCVAELDRFGTLVENTKANLDQCQRKILDAEKSLSDSQNVLRTLEDNFRMRKAKREIQAIDAEIEGLDEDGARKANQQFDKDYQVQRHKQQTLQTRSAELGGEIGMSTSDLKSKKEELQSEYKDIDIKYKTELIKVKTAEVANSDLEKYGKALDSAIMSFHGSKMEEINRSITELWSNCYQGVDIDTILIKSDAEGKTVGGRSYNYRVVMVKDKTEMDMRGRCSAGQKVLASIVIRLALADSFSENCGILALDEPTTNLDKPNIEALAGALADLIDARKTQKNFQLIVITHDETFLRRLGGSAALDQYWRISRKAGGQTSMIERQQL